MTARPCAPVAPMTRMSFLLVDMTVCWCVEVVELV